MGASPFLQGCWVPRHGPITGPIQLQGQKEEQSAGTGQPHTHPSWPSRHNTRPPRLHARAVGHPLLLGKEGGREDQAALLLKQWMAAGCPALSGHYAAPTRPLLSACAPPGLRRLPPRPSSWIPRASCPSRLQWVPGSAGGAVPVGNASEASRAKREPLVRTTPQPEPLPFLPGHLPPSRLLGAVGCPGSARPTAVCISQTTCGLGGGTSRYLLAPAGCLGTASGAEPWSGAFLDCPRPAGQHAQATATSPCVKLQRVLVACLWNGSRHPARLWRGSGPCCTRSPSQGLQPGRDPASGKVTPQEHRRQAGLGSGGLCSTPTHPCDVLFEWAQMAWCWDPLAEGTGSGLNRTLRLTGSGTHYRA